MLEDTVIVILWMKMLMFLWRLWIVLIWILTLIWVASCDDTLLYCGIVISMSIFGDQSLSLLNLNYAAYSL